MGFTKPEEKNDRRLPVRLVLCFDGTGDTAVGAFDVLKGEHEGGKDSIWTIFEMTKAGVVEAEGKETFQYVRYFEGVGTVGVREGAGILTRAAALFDTMTGNGYLDILREGYKVCCQQLQPIDGAKHELFIFGFSRGAFIARALASFLQHVGIIKAESLDPDPQKEELFLECFEALLERYAAMTRKSLFGVSVRFLPFLRERSRDLLPFCFPSPRVRLVGAFDTVKTVIPLRAQTFFQHRVFDINFEMDAPLIVDHFRHALALNESRPLFNPDLWKSDAGGGADCSYLESWFFGYHHDIGGGDTVQGLALWPLQWVLGAAVDYGIVLDPEVEPYSVLFEGGGKLIETPHNVSLKMYDMIKHHTETKGWGLRLNQPFSFMPPQPRNYIQCLTKPPYLAFLKPRVFLNPSAYLVFDVSSSFRMQVVQWKYFRDFLRGRFSSLLENSVPWWEVETVEGILKENRAAERLNLLVIGRPGTGKAEMVGRIFGHATGMKECDISTPASIPGNKGVCVYYSDGFGDGGIDDRGSVERFLEEHRTCSHDDGGHRIHAIWYFLDSARDEIAPAEREFFEMSFGEIPVLVVLKNEDTLRRRIMGSNIRVQKEFGKRIAKIEGELSALPVCTYVHAGGPVDTAKTLLRETALYLGSESLNNAQIKAQRIDAKPIIALATEESVRAYTIWHTFATTGKKHAFTGHKHPAGTKLPLVLMEPILATFNLRFQGDAALIRALIGEPWCALDQYKDGLLDAKLPGPLILMCMLDTIIVMAHAMAHQRIDGRPKRADHDAEPLSKEDLAHACQWYTSLKKNVQEETHAKIKALLKEDGAPADDSVAGLQMKVFEMVDVQSEGARDATVMERLWGVVKKTFWGVTGRT